METPSASLRRGWPGHRLVLARSPGAGATSRGDNLAAMFPRLLRAALWGNAPHLEASSRHPWVRICVRIPKACMEYLWRLPCPTWRFLLSDAVPSWRHTTSRTSPASGSVVRKLSRSTKVGTAAPDWAHKVQGVHSKEHSPSHSLSGQASSARTPRRETAIGSACCSRRGMGGAWPLTGSVATGRMGFHAGLHLLEWPEPRLAEPR